MGPSWLAKLRVRRDRSPLRQAGRAVRYPESAIRSLLQGARANLYKPGLGRETGRALWKAGVTRCALEANVQGDQFMRLFTAISYGIWAAVGTWCAEAKRGPRPDELGRNCQCTGSCRW